MDWTSRYLSDVELSLMQQVMFHRWYEHYLKAMVLHEIPVTKRVLNAVKLAAQKKVEIDSRGWELMNVKYLK